MLVPVVNRRRRLRAPPPELGLSEEEEEESLVVVRCRREIGAGINCRLIRMLGRGF